MDWVVGVHVRFVGNRERVKIYVEYGLWYYFILKNLGYLDLKVLVVGLMGLYLLLLDKVISLKTNPC